MRKTNVEMKAIFVLLSTFFIVFLMAPLLILFIYSIHTKNGIGLQNYMSLLQDKELRISISNSIMVSLYTALLTTVLSFMLAYTTNYTRVFTIIKKGISIGIIVPMLLPTITYGFAIMYSFGKQGLLTRLFGRQLFEIYGFKGLLMGYVVYTLPSAFLLINNSFRYIDKKFTVISKIMGDNSLRTFFNTVVRPLIGTIGGVFVLSFVLSFTDFGIPAALGGTYNVVATQLYKTMLGSIPDFNNGAVIAILMLMPAAFGVMLLNFLDKYNFHYDKVSIVEIAKSKVRDFLLGSASIIVFLVLAAVFLVMFLTPFMRNFPYDMSFTLEHFLAVLSANNMFDVYSNSLFVAIMSALFGTVAAYASAIINTRTPLPKSAKVSIDVVTMVTNAIPGMVLGLSYLLMVNSTDLKGTFFILIVSNIMHFFTTPYLMAKNSLSKMNPSWETTAVLMGDSWPKTIIRVIIPNSISTVVEMFSYFFINSMVTISAVIFLVGARTLVITAKMKELQHFAKFDEIFVLSILIFATNLIIKLCCDLFNNKISKGEILK